MPIPEASLFWSLRERVAHVAGPFREADLEGQALGLDGSARCISVLEGEPGTDGVESGLVGCLPAL
jgi:hypothetical protein